MFDVTKLKGVGSLGGGLGIVVALGMFGVKDYLLVIVTCLMLICFFALEVIERIYTGKNDPAVDGFFGGTSSGATTIETFTPPTKEG